MIESTIPKVISSVQRSLIILYSLRVVKARLLVELLHSSSYYHQLSVCHHEI